MIIKVTEPVTGSQRRKFKFSLMADSQDQTSNPPPRTKNRMAVLMAILESAPQP